MKLEMLQQLSEENEKQSLDIKESVSDDIDDLMAQINNMKHFGESFKSIHEEFKVNKGETFVKLADKIKALTRKIQKEM